MVGHLVKAFAAAIRIAALLVGTLTAVSAFPERPVKIVVPFTAGGAVDVVARIIAPKLSDLLGQPVIIEDRAGAGGMVGAAAVAKAPADGYTLLVGTVSTHGTNVSVYANLDYNPVRDFAPIILTSQSPLMMVTRPNLPAKTVSEFIALAREQPGKLSYGSYGVGSINQFAAELFNLMAKTETHHVPYRGSAPALADLMSGQIDYMFDGVSTSSGQVKSGTIRLLGIAGLSRTPVMPEAPTIAESGVPGYDVPVWFGLFAPAGTDPAIIDEINKATNAALAMPDVKEAFAKLGFEPGGGSADVLAKKVETEIEKWKALVRERHISITP
ncbi:MAG TPA: tripartite tricarboxylate transporter substrate binding protein [Xanthobacteraceae bacterium]|nr:tripartite tricarboxylate transporter substrate binding protein [Xanthobacteraceae bacterium]